MYWALFFNNSTMIPLLPHRLKAIVDFKFASVLLVKMGELMLTAEEA